MSKPYIHNVDQGSEAWEDLRRGKATASQIHRILTPKKMQMGSGAKKYAAELVAERFQVQQPDFQPTYWMDYGTEAESWAIDEFKKTHQIEVESVGFVTPEQDSQFGCSPDGFIGEDELIQVKCPKAETLIKYHIDGGLPSDHKIQVHSEIWITGRERSHFYAWHPELTPLHVVVERDEEIIEALEETVPKFLEMVDGYMSKLTKRRPPKGWQFRDFNEELE